MAGAVIASEAKQSSARKTGWIASSQALLAMTNVDDYLSCDSGIWISPLMNFVGPADEGMMSKSKISVGSHNVAQAFGISTTPEMWPCTGAVPRIE
jgi:hypothetical protein